MRKDPRAEDEATSRHRYAWATEFLASLNREPWMRHALCARVGGDFWFPDKGGVSREESMAKAICRKCPVRLPCLQYAMDNGETEGVYGGLSPRDRDQLRRRAA